MSNYIDVNTGEVKVGGDNEVLACHALGSCVALILIDKQKNIGGVAHIMLPGKAPNNSKHPLRYAENAIENLFLQFASIQSSMDFVACIVGGGNVLKRKDDTICESNCISIVHILNQYSIPLIESSVGGFERRSIKYNVKKNSVYYTVGDGKEKLLVKYNNIKTTLL